MGAILFVIGFGGFILVLFIKSIIDGIKLYRDAPEPPKNLGFSQRKSWYMHWDAGREERVQQQVEARRRKELSDQIKMYLESGKKMDAIKAYKDYYECSLSKAKTAIAEIEWELEYERYHEAENSQPYAHGRAYAPDKVSQSAPSAIQIDGMEGHEFEHFCADLLRKNGFSEIKVTPGSGDQGVDILAEKDGVKYAIQCKNYATPLSNKPVQEVNAGKIFYGCHVGVVMTNSTFTPGAVALAKATGVLLWDRAVVQEIMMKEN